MKHLFNLFSRLTAHGSRLTVVLLLSIYQPLIAQDVPRCFEATPEDYQASLLFENSVLVPAASLNSELSIPLHIIYVNDNSGNPPYNDYRVSEEIAEANAVFDGFLSFYVCGYHPYYWTFLKRGGKSPIFVFSHDMIINASPALTQI